MKFILVVIAVLALVWLLRRSLHNFAQSVRARRPAAPAADAEPQPMLVCAQCGVHLPRDEALPGRDGVFCDEGHRRAYEQAHPRP
jgi:uncharacterized protein